MVSFYCETCCATLKKPKLDQHAQRCWAVFTCIDCSTTFEGTSYRAHTSCVTEAEKYEKSVYKGPKHKQQQQQQAASPAPAPTAAPVPVVTSTPAPAPAATPVADATPTTKRARSASPEAEPSSKKSKKAEKKAAKAAAKLAAAAAADAAPSETTFTPTIGVPASSGDPTQPAALAVALEGPDLKGFLRTTLDELVKEKRSFKELRKAVVEKAAKAGFTKEDEVVEALDEAIWVGGEKPKKAFEIKL